MRYIKHYKKSRPQHKMWWEEAKSLNTQQLTSKLLLLVGRRSHQPANSRETFTILCFSHHKDKYLTLSSNWGIDFSLWLNTLSFCSCEITHTLVNQIKWKKLSRFRTTCQDSIMIEMVWNRARIYRREPQPSTNQIPKRTK